MANWTLEDTKACYLQGFGVFHNDDKQYYLQKLDDPDEANETGEDDPPYSGPVFETDPEAIAYVQKKANEGDAVCRKAIEFLIEQKSPDVKEYNITKGW